MIIRIKEIEQTELGDFKIELDFQEKATFEIELINPFNSKEEENFEWYFEKYISEPYTAKSRVESCQSKLREYGERLFKGVFQNNKEVYALYKKIIVEYKLTDLTIEVIGASNDFQAIHWESMKDSELSKPLTISGVIFVRKNINAVYIKTKALASPCINLLIVTARPEEENDVNHRTIQRPLIELIQKSSLRVRPHILRPGTFQRFIQHLDEVKEGYYHIIHFDLHGKVATWKELIKERRANKLSFQQYSFKGNFNIRYGVDDLKEFGGKKAFIFFESDEKGVAVPIEATELAQSLETKHIPICILNACQSAKQEGEADETSLGKALVEKGMYLVLAMRYSVSVTGATKLMEQLYRRLFENRKVEEAIFFGRKELYNQKSRKADLGYEIDLEDWMLPVVYKNRDFEFLLEKFDEEEEIAYYNKRKQYNRYKAPKYGFYGRDLDILKIEKLLLKHNHLLLIGMIEIGKSALLKYLSWWWELTDFVEGVVYLDFSKQHYTKQEIMKILAEKIFSTEEYQATINKQSLILQEGRIHQKLNADRYCLILDNIFQLKDMNLVDFLQGIKGNTLVLYGSVNPENVLQDATFRDNIYRIKGLDKEATYALANSILEKTCGKNIKAILKREESDLHRLLKILMGFPSVMERVLPHIKEMLVVDVLENFKSGDLKLD